MTTEALEQAFATTRSVLEKVEPDQLDGSTPCASWDVRRLVNHIVGGSHWFAISTENGASPEVDDTDWAAGDFVAAFDEGAKRTVAAFNAPGAQEKMITLPFGTLPGGAFMGLATTDAFRGPDGVAPFGPEVHIDASAPAADRLAAFLGRKV